MRKRLFVDMDGTIAVFHPVNRIETLYIEGYFLNLSPIGSVLAAVKQIAVQNPNIEVHILSTYLSDSPYAYTDKSLWLDKYLPEVAAERRVFVPFGTDKCEMVKGGLQPGDYLLDDYTKNLAAWNPSQGVKLLNGINHTRGTWQGSAVRYDKPPHVLARDISRIVELGETIRDEKPQTIIQRQRSYAR
jgi:hypothetical protein